jgi:hypothetical protein
MTLENLDKEFDFKDTNFQLYLTILDDEQHAETPEDVD